MTTKTLTAMFIAILLIAGCGTSKAEEERKKAAHAQTVEARAKAVATQKLEAEGKVCRGQTDTWLKAEAHLNGSLNVGLSYTEYSDQLSNVAVAYEEVPFKKMTLNCLSAAIGAEHAENDFQKAHTTWETCQKNIECSSESIKPQLQAQWTKAETELKHAKDDLEEFEKGNAPSPRETGSGSSS
jgi:hypothetical protein